MGLELTPAEYYARYLGYDDVGLMQALSADRGIGMSAAEIAAFVERKGIRLQQMLRDDHVLFPGAAEFVRRAAAEVPIAIASGAMRREILEITSAAGIDALFTAIVAAGDTPESKPSPEPYRLAVVQLRDQVGRDLDPRRCVAIEDSRWGLESARGAGLRCVGVTSSYPADQLPGAELVVGGLDALSLPALDALCARGRDA
jgi:HAD superfamily hydrolase (TIGR01509 family)